MKTLANCNLKEFLQQANKIRHKAADFYEIIGISDIRKIMPVFKGNETPEEKAKMLNEQGKKNLSAIIDKCIEENIDATVEIVGLMCFKTPEEAAEMDAAEFIDVVFELICSERVVNFFTKMAKIWKTKIIL